MTLTRRSCAALAALLVVGGCGARHTSPLVRQACYNADAQLASVLQPFEALRAKGCDLQCEPLRREIERLAVVCPVHAPTLMANAVIAYDEHSPLKSQQLLDRI